MLLKIEERKTAQAPHIAREVARIDERSLASDEPRSDLADAFAVRHLFRRPVKFARMRDDEIEDQGADVEHDLGANLMEGILGIGRHAQNDREASGEAGEFADKALESVGEARGHLFKFEQV